MEYLKGMTKTYLPLQPGAFYHIFNRGNNGEPIFFREENYGYFLQKLAGYLTPYLDVYAYCLLRNHFHFLVKTKRQDEIDATLLRVQTGNKILSDFSQVISEAFRRFFLCYAKSIKIQEGRTGSLFEKNFKRIEVTNSDHLYWLVNYIHRNPETHGVVADFKSYPYSSYASILCDIPTKLKRQEVLDMFGGREEFVRFHLTNPVNNSDDYLKIE
ncbi:hypothetical protein HRG84_01660 [Flavisolibacter sp. BT320]|nr:hypothetical protein [Flavisolibacter longurius]